jgi:hypothetical protein
MFDLIESLKKYKYDIYGIEIWDEETKKNYIIKYKWPLYILISKKTLDSKEYELINTDRIENLFEMIFKICKNTKKINLIITDFIIPHKKYSDRTICLRREEPLDINGWKSINKPKHLKHFTLSEFTYIKNID